MVSNIATFPLPRGVHGAGLGVGVVRAHPRYADLPPANCPALRRTGRWPDLSSASPTAPPGPGDTTPQVMPSTGGNSHAGPGGQRSRCRTAKKITGLRDQALGRSRGGLTSKIHLACDGSGRPLSFVVTSGNTNDCTQFTTVMEAIRVPRIGAGRPRVRPAHVLGDKGYSSKAIRTWLRRKNIPHTIPERADQTRNRVRRGSRGGRPPVFDRTVYKQRNVVERCFNRLKQWRGIATRYDKTTESYEAAVTLASLLMWA
ncbi:IS5 family transposase [Streptomyces sp. P5-A9]